MRPCFWTDLLRIRQTHTFIHPTKCGGTALEQFFARACPRRIRGKGHQNLSSQKNNPIIVIREPLDRFSSVFHYWKSGAEAGPYQRSPRLMAKYAGATPKQFIQMIVDDRQDDLYADPRWTREHFLPQSHWLPAEAMPYAIVLPYMADLAPVVRGLFDYLRIDVPVDLPKVNVTRRVAAMNLDDEDQRWIRQAFARDFELWDELHHRPRSFRRVIGTLG